MSLVQSYTTRTSKKRVGFTIVELMIVIVVIGILASITIVAYNGIQARARDVTRKSDISNLADLIEIYATKHNGQYPLSSGSTAINSSWSTTGDASWANLVALLSPYGTVPTGDPSGKPGGMGSYNYSYFGGHMPTGYCGGNLLYLITYKLEAEPNQVVAKGDCPATTIDYTSSGMTTLRVTQ